MTCCRCECTYLSVIIGIIAGVLIGVLYALGFVSTGIIFWLYLLVGLAGVFLAPIYASLANRSVGDKCYCNYQRAFNAAAIGVIVASAVGLIVSAFASVTVIAIVLALATFFSVTLVALVICLSRCVCNS